MASKQRMNAADTATSKAAHGSLPKNAVWTVVGNSVYALCQFSMLAVIAKLGTPSGLGRFSLALAVSSPLVVFCMLQLRALQVTDVQERVPFSNYLGMRIWAMLAAMSSITIIATLGYKADTAICIIAIGGAKSIEAVSDVAFGFLQQYERMREVAISQITKGLLALATVSSALEATGSVAWSAIALAGANALTLFLWDLPSLRRLEPNTQLLRPNLRIGELASLLHRALPLGLALAMVTLTASLPRIFLERSGSLEEVGVFAAMMTLTLPGTIVVSALGQSASPRLARAYSQRDLRNLRKLIGGLTLAAGAIGIASAVVVLVGRDWVIVWLYSEAVARRVVHLPLVMLAGVLWCLSSVLGYASVASGRLQQQPIATAACLFVTFVSAWLLIPNRGISGAAICSVISAAVMLPLYGMVMLMKTDSHVG